MKPGVAFQCGQIIRAKVFHQVDLTVLQSSKARRVIRNGADDHFVQLREPFFPVARILVQRNGIIVLSFGEHKRTCFDKPR